MADVARDDSRHDIQTFIASIFTYDISQATENGYFRRIVLAMAEVPNLVISPLESLFNKGRKVRASRSQSLFTDVV